MQYPKNHFRFACSAQAEHNFAQQIEVNPETDTATLAANPPDHNLECPHTCEAYARTVEKRPHLAAPFEALADA